MDQKVFCREEFCFDSWSKKGVGNWDDDQLWFVERFCVLKEEGRLRYRSFEEDYLGGEK